MSDILDVDKLHQSIEQLLGGHYRYRSTGATTAYLALMVGETWLGDPDNVYLYIGDGQVDTVARQFAQQVRLAWDGAATIAEYNHRVDVNGQVFIFKSVLGMLKSHEFLHSVAIDRVFFDVGDATMVGKVDTTEAGQAMLNTLLAALRHRKVGSGDVI